MMLLTTSLRCVAAIVIIVMAGLIIVVVIRGNDGAYEDRKVGRLPYCRMMARRGRIKYIG